MTGPELLRELSVSATPARTSRRVVISTDGSEARREEMPGLASLRTSNKPVRPEVVRDVLSRTCQRLAMTDRAALDRALDRRSPKSSFFAMVDPATADALAGSSRRPRCPTGMRARDLRRRLSRGSVELQRCLARSRTSSPRRSSARPKRLTGRRSRCDDLAGEFANMVCGRWLTAIAPTAVVLARASVGVSRVGRAGGRGRPLGGARQRPAGLDLSVTPRDG